MYDSLSVGAMEDQSADQVPRVEKIYQFNIMLIHRTEHTFSKYPSEDFDHFTIVKDIDNSK